MSSDIVKAPGETLAERLVQAQAQRSPKKGVLLLDTSGSMAEMADGNFTRIQLLRKVIKGLNPERMFVFNSYCWEWDPKDQIPDPDGNTYYGTAFEQIKNAGVTGTVVIVTDGGASDEAAALQHVKGLKLEVVYVGPQPRPPFLDQLVQASGGTIQSSSMSQKGVLQLTSTIKGLLGDGSSTGATVTPPPQP